MANRRQVLDKISRNLDMLGIDNTRGSDGEVVVLGMTISYGNADIQSPEGGVSDAAAPFLGIGIANPGTINIDLGSADLDSAAKVQVLCVCAGHANDIVLSGASTSAVNGRMRGHADLLGMGM